jgi:cytochrome oxidase Cu insertion factor (SCO1/SenC/PrrC family)
MRLLFADQAGYRRRNSERLLQKRRFMKTRIGLAVIILLLSLGRSLPTSAATLNVRDKAPDFTLPDQNGNKVKLSDFLGKKNVVLAFYVLAFTGG